MELQEFVAQSCEVVNELSRAIENREIGLKEVEERILRFRNRFGGMTERNRHCYKYLRRNDRQVYYSRWVDNANSPSPLLDCGHDVHSPGYQLQLAIRG